MRERRRRRRRRNRGIPHGGRQRRDGVVGARADRHDELRHDRDERVERVADADEHRGCGRHP
ncbi:MAG: hypothetical protein ACRDNJ_11590, partial [Solirubrobacteraceae bacterium]